MSNEPVSHARDTRSIQFARWVVRNRFPISVLLVLTTLFFLYPMANAILTGFGVKLPGPIVRVDTEARALWPDHPFIHAQDQFAKEFGSSSLVAVAVVVRDGTIFEPERLEKIQKITQAVDGIGYDSQTDAREERRAELEDDHEAIAVLVDTLILPRFDMRRGSRAILAEHWDSASAADRDRFVTAFYDYLVATYGDLLLQFKPETLRVLPFDGDAAHSPARVHTIITLTDGTEVDVDFVMIGAGQDWRVVDIEAEGVSYVKTYRSQFRVDIAADGLGSVIEWLEQKAASVRAPGTR